MIKGSKICGISDLDTLNFIINHPYPPQFIGFICNYKKSSRYVGVEKLNNLLKLDKKKSNFVAVLVKPDETILEKIHLVVLFYLWKCHFLLPWQDMEEKTALRWSRTLHPKICKNKFICRSLLGSNCPKRVGKDKKVIKLKNERKVTLNKSFFEFLEFSVWKQKLMWNEFGTKTKKFKNQDKTVDS